MIKVIDVDALFDEYIKDYVYKNIGKVKPEEIENQMPVFYQKFGDEKLKELGGKTPNTFYKSYTPEELIECLKEHIKSEISPSDFLCEALEELDTENAILKALESEDENEEFILYLMNVLSAKNSSIGAKRYMDFIVYDYSEPIRELATEMLCYYPDEVSEIAIAEYPNVSGDKRACITEVLSHVEKKDDRVFNILVNEFLANPDNVPLYVGYLVKYGDERALPFIKTAIENEKIGYRDFEELRFAIEALGGKCEIERDFSSDKDYKKIKGITDNKSRLN